MKIKEYMVEELNNMLERTKCIFRLELDIWSDNPYCEVVPTNALFVSNATIIPSDGFYDVIELFFKRNGIILTYNSNRTLFWSESGWDD